jgi:hypothetical protein
VIYTPVSMTEAKAVSETILAEIEGQSVNVVELALIMSYLEVMATLRPLPPADAALRVKYFLAVGMEVIAKVAVSSYEKTPAELLRWEREHEQKIGAMRGTNGRQM